MTEPTTAQTRQKRHVPSLDDIPPLRAVKQPDPLTPFMRRFVPGEDPSIERPPGPRPHPLVGSLPHMARDLLDFFFEMRQYGPLSYASFPGGNLYLLTEPSDIDYVFVRRAKDMHKDLYTQDLSRILGQGLLTSEGKFWRRQRKLVSHAFTPRRVRTYTDAMVESVGRAAGDFRPGTEIDLHEAMGALTLDVVARTIFGADVRDDSAAVADALAVISDYFGGSWEAVLHLPESVPTPNHKAVKKARASIERIMNDVIDARRRSQEDHGDLLSAMVMASDGEGKMSPQQLRDEAMTLFLAGHETTALSITHTFYLLGRNPVVARKLHAELDAVLGDRQATHDDVAKLEYTTRVVKEALRLYPSAYSIGRTSLVDLELRGYRIPAGSQIGMVQWHSHRDPRWFENPEGFDPDRWTPEFERALPRGVYVPFGIGPRVCIGQHFAMLESILLVAGLAQRYRFELVDAAPLEFAPSVTLRPKKGLRVRVEAR